ncbi:MAG TPA: hypothetical protein EYQ24_09870 [Bacteroidetes bacterium]|nr:hypothetical protein [Bacteroidota bacterium]HIL58405.1 hypothetical protein [Rhodothermales bacterium]
MGERRGMVIKNVTESPLTVRLTSRTFSLESQEETPVTAEEVRDRTLRDHLQRRTIAVVRPATEEEAASIGAAEE